MNIYIYIYIYIYVYTHIVTQAWKIGQTLKNSEKHPIFVAYIFYLVTKKKTLDQQVLSLIGKTMKKSEWIQDTTINSSVLEYFHNIYLPDGIKTSLSTHGLGNLIACVRTGQVYNHSPWNIHDGTFKKNN